MRKTNTLKTDKPLPVEKPLPPRPIARLSSLQSPSKDSRVLIDASEIPLHFTATNGETQEWPTLEPSPANSTRSATPADFPAVNQNPSLLESSPLPATPASVYAATTKLADVITGRQSFSGSHLQMHRTSPASSYASAVERSSSVQGRDEHDVQVISTGRNIESPPVEDWNSPSAGVDLPPRKESLHNRISSGHIVPPSPGSAQRFMGLTDFTKDQSSTPSSPETHPHTFSRASFSQLRPGAGSDCNTSPKTLKTASRIPISDAQKATVVDVRKNRLSASSMPKAGMSFGSRRLASPDALKILENGKMRRQLKRATDENTSVAQLERTWTSGSSATTVATNEIPSLSHSLNSSPDHTLAPNSPDMSHSAPSSTQNHQLPQSWTKPTYVGKHDASRLPSNRRPSFHEDMFEDQAYSSARLPPQTSPFTEPLQTIPSEAALSINSANQERKPSSEFTRTLSRLEGRDTPQVPEFDSQTFMQHYGQLTRKDGCNSHHNDTIMENAAAAEKFLAQRQTNGDMNGLLPSSQSTEENDVAFEAPEKPDDSHAEYKISIPVSKWSESTPSDKGLSPPDEGLLIGQESPTNRLPQKSYISKDLPDVPESIRFTSRLPARTHGAGHKPPRQSVFRTFARRKSSPTLGQPKTPGSVRAAREGLQESTPSFARTTASAESKKSTKMPTPNTKKYTVPENAYESRKSVVERSKSKNDGTPKSKVRLRDLDFDQHADASVDTSIALEESLCHGQDQRHVFWQAREEKLGHSSHSRQGGGCFKQCCRTVSRWKSNARNACNTATPENAQPFAIHPAGIAQCLKNDHYD